MQVRRRHAAAAVAAAALLLATVGGTAPAQATYAGGNGRIVFAAFHEGQADLWSVRPTGSSLRRITDDAATELCPAVSSSGSRLAMCRTEGDGVWEIWQSGLDGDGARPVTRLGGFALFPDWNPQGNRIVFSWAPDDLTPSQLMVVQVDSGKVAPLLTEPGFAHENPVWSPDGKRVLYVKERWAYDEEGFPYTVEGQLWTVDVRTGTRTQLTTDDTLKGQTPDWSPDGSHIAYAADDDIWLMRADGSHQRNVTDTPDASEFGAAFSPDGRWIAFTGAGGPVAEGERWVQVMRTDGSQRRVVAPMPGYRQLVPAWQPA
jgi:Tol biopolymer transport system component